MSGLRLRVAAYVGGGPIGLKTLQLLDRQHDLVAVIRPAEDGRGGLPMRLARRVKSFVGRRTDPIEAWCRETGRSPLRMSRTDADPVREALRARRPDVACIATFAFRIPDDVLAIPRAGTVNLHPSLLPRHRGPAPLFWTYHAGDPEGGVSLHAATGRLDAGPVLAAARTPIGRGESAVEVHARYADLCGQLLSRHLGPFAAGELAGTDQDESRATAAPRARPGVAYVDPEVWGVERAWHFLAGLAPHHREPLVDIEGCHVSYRSVPGYVVEAPRGEVGTVTPDGTGWLLWLRDGAVRLDRSPLTRRIAEP